MSLKIADALTVPEGDGVTVKRLLPIARLRNFDPVVLWDHFDIAGGGFPNHPHRGFEGITYLFDGGMHHTDNLGNKGTVHAGGAQRFTAGRGIIHSEFPDGRAHGIQLWINLPKSLKSLPPDYQQADAANIPEHIADGITIRTIVGNGGAIQLHTPGEYLEICMQAQTRLTREITSGHRGLIYVVSGTAMVNDLEVGEAQAALFDSTTEVTLIANSDARMMWCFFCPHGEPILQHGPFVD